MRIISILGLTVLLSFLPAIGLSETAETYDLMIETDSGPHQFLVERAVTPGEMARGLMFRRELANDHGMIFIYGQERIVNMWMRNTYIPLDMIFIGEDGKIRRIAKRTTPLSERTISSRSKVRYVLEINGGLSDELGIEVGQTVHGPALALPQ